MTLDRQDQTDLDAPPSPVRDKPIIHPSSDPPQCDACHRLNLTFFDPNCESCMNILSDPSTPVSKVFAVLRQWTPRTQQILELLVREILKRGIHVNDRDGLTDMTLLHYVSKAAAMGMGDIDEACRMAHLLVSHGADPYIRCRWTNMAAIHYATYFNVAPVLKILLDTTESIDVDSKCSEFENGSPLHIACNHMCLDAAEVLLQYGGNVKEKDGLDRTPRECIPDESEGRNVRELHKLLGEAVHKESAVPMLHYEDVSGKVTLQSLGLEIGETVIVGGVKSGILRFCGPTEFASGMWAGIELDEPAGKNDGRIQGISYFQCPPMHGIFAPMSKITKCGMVMSTPERQTTPPKVSPSHKKLDTSHVTARIDTGLGRSPSKSFPAPDPGELEEGDRVIVAGQREGVIKFSGETKFAPGWWYGIDLDRAVGKNDGSVNGERYFTCKPKHGVFAPPSRVTKVDDLAESRESLDTLANVDKQRRLSAGSGGLPSIYTTPTRSRQNRPRSSGTLGLMKRTSSTNGELKLRERMSVFCNNELGTVKYIGPTEFAEGTWIGVELRTPKGKNDGSVQGKRYFSCKPNYGLIVRPSKVTVRGINGAKLLGDTIDQN